MVDGRLDMALLITLFVFLWMKKSKGSHKDTVPTNDLWNPPDRVRDTLWGNRPWNEDPNFFLRRP